MIDPLQSLWKELLGSWWVLIVLPMLAAARFWLSSSNERAAGIRQRVLAGPFWNFLTDSEATEPGQVTTVRTGWCLEIVDSALLALSLVFLLIRPFILQAFYIPSQSMEETLQIDDRILVNKFVYRFHAPRRGDIIVFDPPPAATQDVGEQWIKRVIGLPGDRISVHGNHLYVNGAVQSEPYAALLDPAPQNDGYRMKHLRTGHYNYNFPEPQLILGLPEGGLAPGKNALIYGLPDDALQMQRFLAKATPLTSAPASGSYLFFMHNSPEQGLEIVVPPGKLFVMGDNRNNSEDSHYWGCLDSKRVIGQAFSIFWPLAHDRSLT